MLLLFLNGVVASLKMLLFLYYLVQFFFCELYVKIFKCKENEYLGYDVMMMMRYDIHVCTYVT